MKRPIGVLVLLVAIVWPFAVIAQESAPPPASTHARAGEGVETALDLENARLIVPVGAVTPGAVIAFGTGGIPTADGRLNHTSVLVSASGGLHAPVIVLITPASDERAALGSGTPALRATAGDAVHPCATGGSWIACPVPWAGAFVLEVTDEPPSSDPLVLAALDRVPVSDGEGPSPLLVRVLIIAGAAIGGGAIAWLLGRPRTRGQEPAERG